MPSAHVLVTPIVTSKNNKNSNMGNNYSEIDTNIQLTTIGNLNTATSNKSIFTVS